VQWCSRTSHDKCEGGSKPSSGSSALPEKLIVSPTFQVSVPGGVRIVATGGEFATTTVTEATVDTPTLSVTFTDTVTGPGVA